MGDWGGQQGGGYQQGGGGGGWGGGGGYQQGGGGGSFGGSWGGGGGRGGNVRPGDWQCPAGCGNVFASKMNCFRCGAPKPENAEVAGGDQVRALTTARSIGRSEREPTQPQTVISPSSRPTHPHRNEARRFPQIAVFPLADALSALSALSALPALPALSALALATVRRRRRIRTQRRQLGRRWRRLELRRRPRLQRPPSRPHAPPRGLELPRRLRPRVCVQAQLLSVRHREARGRRPRVRPEAGRRLPARRRRRGLERPQGRLSPRRPAVRKTRTRASSKRQMAKTGRLGKRKERVPSRFPTCFVFCVFVFLRVLCCVCVR